MISMHKSGDIIYKAQDKPKSVFIIHSGSIEILTKNGVPLATLNEGEIFGEISEILTARAKTDCSLMHIENSTIESKLQTTDPAIKGIIRALALRLSETSRKYEALWDELQIYKSLKPK